MSFSNPGRAASGTAGPSTKHAALGHKRHASTSEGEQHGSGHIKHNKSSEVPSRPHSSRSARDSRHSGSGGRDQLPDGAGLLHPSDMFIVKKKRQERARSSIGSPSSSGQAGPLSPTNPVRLGMVPSPRGARTPFQRDTHPSQHSMHSTGWVAHSDQGGSSSAPGIGDIQWAKPSKRQRTDSGKRRLSHL
jgi:SWI/SNF-related matrix-associated actin-dependent regulator of chromatin subfamily A protein 2/4